MSTRSYSVASGRASRLPNRRSLPLFTVSAAPYSVHQCRYPCSSHSSRYPSQLSLSHSFDLSAEAPPPAAGEQKKPSFSQKPSIQRSGTSVVLTCVCSAAPQPSITWFRDKHVVKESSRHIISTTRQEGDSYILTLEILVSSLSYNTLCFWKLQVPGLKRIVENKVICGDYQMRFETAGTRKPCLSSSPKSTT